jgi:hypothetical protein
VSRAVERLREFFSKRGVAIGASGLVVVISANAVQSAPLALAAALSSATFAGTTIQTSTAVAAPKAIAITLAATIGTGIYEGRQVSQLREQSLAFHQQQIAMAAQIEQLKRELDKATNQVAVLNDENALLKSGHGFDELLKLRSEVGMLRRQQPAGAANTARSMAQLMNASSSKELARAQILEKLKSGYAPLAQRLNLSPAQTTQLYDLIADNEINKKEMLAKLLSGDLEVDAALQTRSDNQAELNNRIIGLLGDAGYAQFDQYTHDMAAADLVKGLNQQLGSLALSDDQSKQLQELFAAKPDITLDDTDLFRPKESLDALFQTLVDRGHHDLQQATAFLAPEQLAAACAIQSNYFNTIRKSLTLGQKVVSEAAAQNAP